MRAGRMICMDCGKFSSEHRTGKCPECRTRRCAICDVQFIYQRVDQTRCGPHRGIVDKEAYLTRKNNAVTHYRDIRYPRSMT